MGRVTPPAPPVVLVLQNEPLLRMQLADFIEEAGCVALETYSTAEAIRLLETRPDIRVVIADLDVRGTLMGMQLAVSIRDRWPPIELMLTGAFRPDLATLPVRGMFFEKPFDERIVIPTVRRLAGL